MRMRIAAIPALVGLLAAAAPALADSVSVSSGSDGTTIVKGKPCRVVTCENCGSGSNSTSITTGAGGLSGSTTVTPGGNGASSSVTAGSGSSTSSGGKGAHSSSASSSDCVIYRNPKK